MQNAHPRYETEPGRQLQFDWKERLLPHGRDGTELTVFEIMDMLTGGHGRSKEQ
jgi:hypothetical protein